MITFKEFLLESRKDFINEKLLSLDWKKFISIVNMDAQQIEWWEWQPWKNRHSEERKVPREVVRESLEFIKKIKSLAKKLKLVRKDTFSKISLKDAISKLTKYQWTEIKKLIEFYEKLDKKMDKNHDWARWIIERNLGKNNRKYPKVPKKMHRYWPKIREMRNLLN